MASEKFCKNIVGRNMTAARNHREAVAMIADDLRRFKEESGVDRVVVVNLASTEAWPDLGIDTLNSVEAFERGLDESERSHRPGDALRLCRHRQRLRLRQFHAERRRRRARR